jgi:flagella basal body P-ring formation protein FlgA
MYEYRTRLHLAEMRKEKGTGKKPEIEIIGSRKSQNEVEIPPNIAQQTYQQKYSAPAQPSIQKPAPMQQIQKPSLQQPIQKPSFSQSAASMPAPFIENQKTPAPQPTKTTSQVQQNPELASAIEAKFGGKISDQKIAELEEKINELLNKKAITKDQAISDIRGADSDRIVESFNKLISLIEMEHLAKQDAVQKRAIKSSTPIEPVQLKKQEIVEKGIEKQLQQQEITTSFDQILSIVKEKGRISSKDLAKSQNVPEKKVIELCKLLEDENLIVLNYLPVGGVIAQDINYLPPKGKTQKKEDENAKD